MIRLDNESKPPVDIFASVSNDNQEPKPVEVDIFASIPKPK